MPHPRWLSSLGGVPLLSKVASAAAGSRQSVFLTGGFLRDRLLGIPPKAELDLTAEDPPALLEHLRAGQDLTFFLMDRERSTYRLVFPPGSAFRYADLTRLRARSIEGDLRLRDFTVNALAAAIYPREGAPKIIDPTDGLPDLKRRRLRACSPQSFADDPLRILRGVRLAVNLGLSLTGETQRLMEKSRGSLGKVSSERVRDELFQILQGPAPAAGMVHLLRPGFLRHLGPSFQPASSPSLKHLRRACSLAGRFPNRSTIRGELNTSMEQNVSLLGILGLAAFLLDRDGGDGAGRLSRRLALGKKAGGGLSALLDSPIPARWLRKSRVIERGELLTLYRGYDTIIAAAAILSAGGLEPAAVRKRAVEDFLRRYRATRRIFMKPRILTGKLALRHLPIRPGPALGDLLRGAREAQDLGHFKDLKGALSWSRDHLNDSGGARPLPPRASN